MALYGQHSKQPLPAEKRLEAFMIGRGNGQGVRPLAINAQGSRPRLTPAQFKAAHHSAKQKKGGPTPAELESYLDYF